MTDNKHPLWEFIRRCNAYTGAGPIEYEPLPFPDSNTSRHKEESNMVLDFWMNAVALFCAIEGDPHGMPKSFDPQQHRELFQFVTSTPIGMTIGLMAAKARKSIVFIPAFWQSIRFPEFVPTVSKWMVALEFPGDSDWKKSLEYLCDCGSTDPQRFDYFFASSAESV